MTTLQESNERVFDLNVHRDYCHNRTPVEAFSELISNACSADPTRLPVIRHDITTKKVFIEDCGPGIKKEHFIMGRSQGEGHSHHGIGLKDAIAILRRDYKATITIRSLENCFNFNDRIGSLGVETLHLIVRDGFENIRGTQIEIDYRSAGPDIVVTRDIAKAKESFLVLFQATLTLVASDDQLEMYVPRDAADTSRMFDYIFVMGVRKGTARPFKCVYNIKGPLAKLVKSMIDRDHNISKKKKQFNREIFSKIQQFAFESVRTKPEYSHLRNLGMYEFHRPSAFDTTPRNAVPPPPLTASATGQRFAAVQPPAARPTAARPVAQPAPRPTAVELEVDNAFHPSLIKQVYASLGEQNSAMITLSPGERTKVRNASATIQEKLKETPDLSIAEIRYSGSIAKNTAVPHSVDVDLVVFLNDFDPRRVADYARIIKTELASRECRFLSSAPDILECVYASINIDIVLTSAADIDHPRYQEFQSGPEAVTYFKRIIGDNAWVAEVVRAAKFWIMRCNDDDSLRVKSLAVELVVLEVFKASEVLCASRSTEDNRKALFLSFLRFLTRPSVEQRVLHLSEEKQQLFEGIKQPFRRYKRLAEATLLVPTV